MKRKWISKETIPKMKDGRLPDLPKKKHVYFSFNIGGGDCWHGCDKVSIIGGKGGGGS